MPSSERAARVSLFYIYDRDRTHGGYFNFSMIIKTSKPYYTHARVHDHTHTHTHAAQRKKSVHVSYDVDADNGRLSFNNSRALARTAHTHTHSWSFAYISRPSKAHFISKYWSIVIAFSCLRVDVTNAPVDNGKPSGCVPAHALYIISGPVHCCCRCCCGSPGAVGIRLGIESSEREYKKRRWSTWVSCPGPDGWPIVARTSRDTIICHTRNRANEWASEMALNRGLRPLCTRTRLEARSPCKSP